MNHSDVREMFSMDLEGTAVVGCVSTGFAFGVGLQYFVESSMLSL